MSQIEKNNTNWLFGLVFLTVGTGLLIHSVTDFLTYNFTTTLFIFMRSNSSIIAEFIFGVLLCISGLQIFTKRTNWLNSIKIFAIGIVVNLVFSISLRVFEFIFDWQLVVGILIRVLIGFGIYKLTEYLVRINASEWNIKNEKTNLLIGLLIGFFPFLFRNILF